MKSAHYLRAFALLNIFFVHIAVIYAKNVVFLCMLCIEF